MRKISLALFFFFWIWKLAQLSTASQDWISLRGCYDYKNETGSIVPFNEPQSCFDRCPNSTAVGLKNSTCICYQSYTYRRLSRDSRCDLKCPGKPFLYCGAESGSNDLINVYSKDPPQTNDINENTDYGFVSVSITQSGQTYYASKNNSTSRNGYICYDDIQVSDPCHHYDGNPDYTWEEASERCHQRGHVLIAFSNIPLCVRRPLFIGLFWIGLYRNSPGSGTPATTTSTSAEPRTSTSTEPTTSTFASTLTPATTTKCATVSLLGHEWTSSVTGTGATSEGSSDDGIKALYVAVPVVAAVLAAVVFALVSWKRKIICFKPRHIRVETNVLGNPKNNVSLMSSNGNNSENVPQQVDAGNNSSAQEGYRTSVGIEPGVLQQATITNECIVAQKKTEGKRNKIKKHSRKRKKKHKKKRQIEAPEQANVQKENSSDDHAIHADMNNKGQFDTTGISQLYPHTENVESQGESKEKHKKKNRKHRKRSHETGLVEETEGVQYITIDHVRNSDIYTGGILSAASMNLIPQQAENEHKLEDDRRTHKRKKKRKEKKKSKNKHHYDDDNK